MVSRRKILSRSRDDLIQADSEYTTAAAAAAANIDDEDDVWYNKDKLYRDHMQEVLEKWTQIDDEIWAKVICFERNRRVAKAYARTPVLTINGSDDGFDGYRIGLMGFDNPMRDAKTEEVKRHIGHGVKLKMDDAGNILIKRVSKANVFVKNLFGQNQDNSISIDALRLRDGALEMDKPVKLFDMKKFQHNVSRELKRSYPDRRKLEFQCISAIVFVKNDQDILDCPCWVIVINIVAMDMLKSKLPLPSAPNTLSIRRQNYRTVDEDPYSVPGQPDKTGSSMSNTITITKRADRPPKLPPRDTGMSSRYQIPKPDYEEQQKQTDDNKYRLPHLQSTMSRKTTKSYPDQDPYYYGMQAHVPNFASKKSATLIPAAESPYARTWMMTGQNDVTTMNTLRKQQGTIRTSHPVSLLMMQRQPESIYDTRNGAIADDHYSQIYGRISLPRFVNNYRPKTQTDTKIGYVGEWE